MAGLQHARIGASLEVASASLAGHRFEKHSHDEFVISANLCGLEDVWLDGRTFQADSGDLTLNPGQIQGGGVRDGQPWRFASLYLPAAELASSLDLSFVEFDRPLLRNPALGRELAASIEALLASDRFARERGESACWSSSAACWRRAAPACRRGPILGARLSPACRRCSPSAWPSRRTWMGWRSRWPVEIPPAAGVQEGHRAQPATVEHALRTRRALGLLRRGLAVGEVATPWASPTRAT